MIKIAKFGDENSEKLREVIRNNINMLVKDGDCYIFNSSQYLQKVIKDAFPEAQLEIIPSDEDLYHDSYKSQSAMKLRKFRRMNESLKDEDTILVIIKSHPREAKEDKAEEFAQYVVKNCYVKDEKSKVQLTIRGWLRKQFMTLKTEKKFQDKNGKELEPTNVFVGGYNYPVVKPIDKAIKVKLFVKLGEAQAIIDVMNKRELISTIDFVNTQIRRERREAKVEKKNKSKFANRKSKVDGEKRSEKKTEEANAEKKDEKKRDGRFKNRKSAISDNKEEKELKEKRPQQKRNSRKEEPVEDIVIEVAEKKQKPRNSSIIIDLSDRPEHTSEKLIDVLQKKLDFV